MPSMIEQKIRRWTESGNRTHEVYFQKSSPTDWTNQRFFRTGHNSERPYMKPFIHRVLCLHRELFCSFSHYAIRLRVEPFFLAALHRAVGTIAVNDPQTQIWVREASKFQIRNNRWMCQKAEPVISGTVRKLVNRGTHLVCMFSTYTKRRPWYSSTK